MRASLGGRAASARPGPAGRIPRHGPASPGVFSGSARGATASELRKARARSNAGDGGDGGGDAGGRGGGGGERAAAAPAPPPAVDLLIVDATNVACGAAAISKRWRRRKSDDKGKPEEEEGAASSASSASVAGATAGALRWLAASAGWPRARVALFDPPPKSQGSFSARRGEDPRYLVRRDKRAEERRKREGGGAKGGPSSSAASSPSSSALGPPPALAKAAASAGFLPLAARPGFEADDALAQLLLGSVLGGGGEREGMRRVEEGGAAPSSAEGRGATAAPAQTAPAPAAPAAPSIRVAVASGDRGWWDSAAAAASSLSSSSSASPPLLLALPPRWAAEPGPPPELRQASSSSSSSAAISSSSSPAAAAATTSAAPQPPCPFLVSALTDGGSSGLRGAGLRRKTAAALASRHGNSLESIAEEVIKAGPSSSSLEKLPARDWRVVLAPGSEGLRAARAALRMLKPRTGGGGGGGGGKGEKSENGPLSASAVARVAELLLAAAAPSSSSSSSSAPFSSTVPVVGSSSSRAAAWRNPAARARLSAGRARFRAASAAMTAAAAAAGTPLPLRARALASFSGTPVDLEVPLGGTDGPVALFVGLPGDYGHNRTGDEGSSRPLFSSPSRSSPTLTSVVKRLRRSGVPAAIFPYWEFDAAAERGRLAEAILEAARGALERL